MPFKTNRRAATITLRPPMIAVVLAASVAAFTLTRWSDGASTGDAGAIAAY